MSWGGGQAVVLSRCNLLILKAGQHCVKIRSARFNFPAGFQVWAQTQKLMWWVIFPIFFLSSSHTRYVWGETKDAFRSQHCWMKRCGHSYPEYGGAAPPRLTPSIMSPSHAACSGDVVLYYPWALSSSDSTNVFSALIRPGHSSPFCFGTTEAKWM